MTKNRTITHLKWNLKKKHYPKLTIPIEINKTNTGRLIFYCHGFSSDKDGYKHRHKIIGDLLAKENIGSFIRFTESKLWKLKKDKNLLITTYSQDLIQVIKFIISRSKEICGSSNPELILTGFSAGAGVCMNVCNKYNFKKMLLLAPAYQTNKDLRNILKKIKKFKNEVIIVHGKQDEVEPITNSEMFYKNFKTKKKLVKIPNCDHGFLNNKNNKIFIKSFFDFLR